MIFSFLDQIWVILAEPIYFPCTWKQRPAASLTSKVSPELLFCAEITQIWNKNTQIGPKRPYLGQKLPKLALNDPFWAKTTKLALSDPIWAKITQIGPKRPNLGLKNLMWTTNTQIGSKRPELS